MTAKCKFRSFVRALFSSSMSILLLKESPLRSDTTDSTKGFAFARTSKSAMWTLSIRGSKLGRWPTYTKHARSNDSL